MTEQPEGELRMIDGWPYRVVDRRLIRNGPHAGKVEVTLRDEREGRMILVIEEGEE